MLSSSTDRRVQAVPPVNEPGSVSAVVADESKSASPLVKRLPVNTDTQSASEPDIVTDDGSRPSKRCHTDQSSDGEDELGDRYIYVPVSLCYLYLTCFAQKCDRCKDRGLVCRVPVSPRDERCACTPCKRHKHRCSAIRGHNRVTKPIDTSTVKPAQKSIVDMFRSREMGSAVCPPFKRSRGMFFPRMLCTKRKQNRLMMSSFF